ncbi:MAG TPA: LLM class flavin-dependent oxidoreductase [Xanthobacteraceae bacterium]|nr:LLM class flavin-dependent oxidoreductase [Xanthobacteraceae bacterium]
MRVSVCSLGEENNARFLEQVKLAEQLGFHAFMHADEKWTRDPYVRIAAATRIAPRIGFGFCVTDPYTRHPALSAQALATLAELAPGRLRVTMGAGSHFETLPTISNPKPVKGIREGIGLMRSLWKGERVTLDGEIIKFKAGKLDFEPQAVPEVYIASRSPLILALGGEIADGVLIGSFATAPGIEYAKSQIQKGLDRAKRTWKDIQLCSWVYVTILDREDEEIPENIKRGMSHAFWSSRKSMTEMVDKLSGDVTPEFRKFLHEAPHEWSPEVMAELRRLMPRGIFNTMSIVGTAKQVVERLKSLETVGVQEAIMWPFPKPGQEVEDMLIQLGHEVLPHVSVRPKREAYRLVD